MLLFVALITLLNVQLGYCVCSTSVSTNCSKLFTNVLTYEQAYSACQALGTFLTLPISSNDKQAIRSIFGSQQCNTDGTFSGTAAWVYWQTDTMANIVTPDWRPNYVTDSSKLCIAATPCGWYQEECNKTLNYICYLRSYPACPSKPTSFMKACDWTTGGPKSSWFWVCKNNTQLDGKIWQDSYVVNIPVAKKNCSCASKCLKDENCVHAYWISNQCYHRKYKSLCEVPPPPSYNITFRPPGYDTVGSTHENDQVLIKYCRNAPAKVVAWSSEGYPYDAIISMQVFDRCSLPYDISNIPYDTRLLVSYDNDATNKVVN